MRQRIRPRHSEQRFRPEPGNTEGAIAEQIQIQATRPQNRRHEQRIGPGSKADKKARHDSPVAAATPQDSADETRRKMCHGDVGRRGELRHGGKGQKPDLSQRSGPGEQAEIDVSEANDEHDRDAADHLDQG